MADFLKSATSTMKGAVASLTGGNNKNTDSTSSSSSHNNNTNNNSKNNSSNKSSNNGSQSARGPPSPRHADYGSTGTGNAPYSARPGHSAGPQYPEPEPVAAGGNNFGQKLWSRARSDFTKLTNLGKSAPPPPPPPPPPPAPEQKGIAGLMNKAKQGTVDLGKKMNDAATSGMQRAQTAVRDQAMEQAKADPKKAFTVVKALVKMST